MSEQKPIPSRRRTHYIQRKFQTAFIVRFCFIALGAMILTSVILYLLTRDTLTTTFTSSGLAIQETSWIILPNLIITNLIVLACFIVATVFLTLYMSHRIGGPLHQIEKMIDLVSHGNLKGRVSLRKGDQLKCIGSKFNHMMAGLNNRVRQIQTKVGEVKALTQSPDEQTEEVKIKIEKLDEMVHQLFDAE